MALPRRVLLALSLALLAAALSAPDALAQSTGGAQVPTGNNGGAGYGSTVQSVQRRPIAKTFRVSPKSIKYGSLPSVAVRIQQRGVTTVRLRVVLVKRGERAASATLTVKRARTGQLLHPKWPSGTKLAAGSYVARVHATSPDGATLRRTAKAAGRTTITVLPKPKPKVKKKPPVKQDPEPQDDPVTPAPTTGDGGVFPVQGAYTFGSDGARFGAGRPGHIHQGQDVLAASGLPVVAPLAGTVRYTKYQKKGAGYYVVMDAVDGRSFFFAHCLKGSTAVDDGQTVTAGHRLCQVGMSGTASGPHLHFEIWVGGWRVDKNSHPIDPLPQLRAWAGL